MRNCYVPGCDQQHKNSSKRPMFLVPKNQDLLQKWTEVLPKVRPLRAHDKICHLHFHTEDVIYNYEHTIKGKIYQLERGRPRLKPNAVPSINLPTNEEIKELLSKPTKRTQKEFKAKNQSLSDVSHTASQGELAKECALDEQMQLTETENTDSAEQNEVQTAEIIDEPDEISHTFEYIYDNFYEVKLPNTLWAIHRCPDRTAIFFSYIDVETMLCSKVISIAANGLIKVLVENQLLYELTLHEDIQTVELLASLVTQVDSEICTEVEV